MYQDSPPDRFGPIALRNGKPIARVGKPPCGWCPKQPIEVPESERTPLTAIELSERNVQAWIHYRECQAVNSFPSDEIVRRNAAVIRQAEQAHADRRQLIALMTAGSTRRGV